VLKTSISDIALDNAQVMTAGLRHAYDVDEVEAQGCVDHFELEAELGSSGCTLRLIFAADEAGAGLVYASLDVDSFCPGFGDAEEGLYERADGWAPVWFGLTQIENAIASETCVAGDWLSFDATPLRLLRNDGTKLVLDLSDVSFSGWIPSEQDPSGACVSEATCGQAHDGGDGWCILAGCSPDFHDGGGGTCVLENDCIPGYVLHRGECALVHIETVELIGGAFDPIGTSLGLAGPCGSTQACEANIAYAFKFFRSGDDKQQVSHAVFTETAWDISPLDDSDEPAPFGPESIAMDSDGQPHVCYFELPDNGSSMAAMQYARFVEGVWTSEYVDDGRAVSMFESGCSIELDGDDRPHIAYAGDGNSLGTFPQLAYLNASSWSVEIIDTNVRADEISLALDQHGVPHVAYASDGFLRYARRAASTTVSTEPQWELATIFERDPPTVTDAARRPSLVLDRLGSAHVAYRDAYNDRLRYALGTVDNWLLDTVDPDGDGGAEASIALDAQGRPHIAYVGAFRGSLRYAYLTSEFGRELQWDIIRVDSLRPGGVSLQMDSDGNARMSYFRHESVDQGLEYAIVARARRCPDGTHNGGDDVCVANYTCSEGFRDGGSGLCVPNGECSPGFHDGGDGTVCLPLDTCLPGYHDGGGNVCISGEGCREGYHDGGDGACVRVNTCTPNYHNGGDGVCVLNGECSPGYHIGGRYQCLPLGECEDNYHDGGDGACVPLAECSPGYHLGGGPNRVCLPEGECSEGYYDGGGGVCVSNGCASGYHDGGDGSCVPFGECSAGYHDGGNGDCYPLGECHLFSHDGGDGTCVPLDTCSPGYTIVGGTCVPE
jgi:hypothetical protein